VGPIWQLIIDALGMGMIYVLLASGLNLIMSTNKILLVAYGNFYMLGAYIVWFFTAPLKFPFFASLVIATIVTAILGGIVYLLIFRNTQFKEQRFLANLVAALGLMLIIGQFAVLAFGTAVRGLPPVFKGSINLGGASITMERVVLIVLALVLTLCLSYFLLKTNLGRAIRAVAFRSDVAALQGINSGMVYLATMAVGCGIAGFAGAIMAPVFAVSPSMSDVIMMVLLVVILSAAASPRCYFLG
jgi:branched-chain amino acid transport system permease protein